MGAPARRGADRNARTAFCRFPARAAAPGNGPAFGSADYIFGISTLSTTWMTPFD